MRPEPCVIVPRDLLDAISQSGQLSGWFGGISLREESLYFVLDSEINTTRVDTTIQHILPHRAAISPHEGFQERLVQWAVVKPGFGEKFVGINAITDTDFRTSQIKDAQIGDIPIAIIEPTDFGPTVITRLLKKSTEDLITVLPADSIVLEREAKPFANLSPDLVEILAKKTVAVVGLGSGGSEIALNLACCGVGTLELIDFDRVLPQNYIRYPAGRIDLGRYKVDVVRSAIAERNLKTDVRVRYLDVVKDANEFRDVLASGVDVVVCATDSVESRRIVNCVALRLGIDLIIVGTLAGGRIGEILRVSPRRSACYECLRSELSAVLEPVVSEGRPEIPYGDSSVGNDDNGALRMDLTAPAALASHLVLQVLAPILFMPAPAPYIVWGRDANTGFGEPFEFALPFATNYFRARIDPDCPVCGSLFGATEGIDVNSRVQEILALAAQGSTP